MTPTLTFDTSNHVSGGPLGYDPAGNVNADSSTGNSYLYDGEGRVCAVKSEPAPGTYTITGYLYDAEGTRIAKGSLTNCTSSTFMTSCSCDPTANGFQISENYVLGLAGEELSMLDGNNNWQRTNVYAGGKLVGTYDSNGLHFHLEDPLGTRRMQLSGNSICLGAPETDIQSLPFGDGLYSFTDQYACATADDATPLHFTGKERDTESGNDYFDARYYSSAMGRFLSPDWSAKEDPVPYAQLDDPQSLNLYAYVRNNPLINVDADGHDCNGWGCLQQKLTEAEKAMNEAEAAARIDKRNEQGFKTSDQAGSAALSRYNPTSIRNNEEIGGLVYKGKDGKYHYSPGVSEGSGMHVNSFKSPLPEGIGINKESIFGQYHTHGDYSFVDEGGNLVRTTAKNDRFNSDHFSQDDKVQIRGNAQFLLDYNFNYAGYLGTPSGAFLKYDPWKKKEMKLAEDSTE